MMMMMIMGMIMRMMMITNPDGKSELSEPGHDDYDDYEDDDEDDNDYKPRWQVRTLRARPCRW